MVVYTSVDQPYSEPILKRFQDRTGIRILPVYDVEAAKTTGLANRLLAEKSHPRADVFWNGEFAQTILLKERGALAPYASPQRARIPVPYRDPDAYWTGFGGRARVLLVHDTMPAPYPDSIFDLLDETWPADAIGIAYPLFGTTATQAAALYAALGPERGRAYFADLHSRGVRVLDGNAAVRDWVVGGRLTVGLTDTDDACAALGKGAAVTLVLPDQQPGGLGTLVIPNSVALIANGPNPKEAKTLIDFLLSEQVERLLIASGWIQVGLGQSDVMAECIPVSTIKGMDVSLTQVYEVLEQAKKELGEIFIR